MSNLGISCEQGGDNRAQVIVGFASSRVRVAARRIGADPFTTVRFWQVAAVAHTRRKPTLAKKWDFASGRLRAQLGIHPIGQQRTFERSIALL